jgi:hypothetical protein
MQSIRPCKPAGLYVLRTLGLQFQPNGSNSYCEGHLTMSESFDKILKTLCGTANLRKGVRGYILFDVANTAADAKPVTELYGVNTKPFERFFITGV